MAWNERHVVAQRPKPIPDGMDELIVIPARQVGAAYGASEQHIADQGQAPLAMEIHHMALGMARTMQDFQNLLAESHLIALLQPAVRAKGGGGWKAKHQALLGQSFDEACFCWVRAFDGDGKVGSQFRRPAHMVKMAVGEKNLHRANPGFGDCLNNQFHIPAGIDHGGLQCVFAPQQGAILLEGGDWEGEGLHEVFDVC